MVETAPIVLYGEKHWDSPWVFTVLVALREKGVPFDVRVLDLDAKEQQRPEFRQRSLTARVPAIEDGDFVLSESSAIVEYLEERFPAPAWPRLLPVGVRERARARQILGWLRSDLGALREERPTTTMFFETSTRPLSPAAQAAAEKLFTVSEALLPAGAGCLFGEFCVADAELAFALHRLMLNRDAVPERLERYARAVWQRPSVREFVEHAR